MDDGRDVQEIHVKTEIEVGIGYVFAVADVLDVPEEAIEGRTDVTEQLCEGGQLAGVVCGLFVGDTGDEEEAVLGDLGDGG